MIQNQQADGSWPGDSTVGPIGVTALTLLAFLSDGNTLNVGPYRESMSQACAWLVSQQDPTSGCIGVSEVSDLKEERALLDHAWATYALSELVVLNGEPSGREGERADALANRLPAARALASRALLAAQQEDGSFGTARATGWSAYALFSAKESGHELDTSRLVAARDALKRMVPVEGDPAHLHAGKVALRCLIGFMVQGPSEEELMDHAAIAAMGQVVDVPDLWAALDPESRMLMAFAAFQCGGKTWKSTNQALKTSVVQKQVTGDTKRGVFPAERGCGEARATAWGVMATTVYFRYARILGAR